MMVPNPYNEQLRPNLQVVTDHYVDDLLRLEQAAGCLPSLRTLARIAVGSVKLPMHLASAFWQDDYEETL